MRRFSRNIYRRTNFRMAADMTLRITATSQQLDRPLTDEDLERIRMCIRYELACFGVRDAGVEIEYEEDDYKWQIQE